MPKGTRRSEIPITTAVAVTQGLSWGPSKAQALIAAIDARTRGCVHIHVGLIYKVLEQLIERGLVRRTDPPTGAAIYQLTAAGKRQVKAEGQALGGLFEG